MASMLILQQGFSYVKTYLHFLSKPTCKILAILSDKINFF